MRDSVAFVMTNLDCRVKSYINVSFCPFEEKREVMSYFKSTRKSPVTFITNFSSEAVCTLAFKSVVSQVDACTSIVAR